MNAHLFYSSCNWLCTYAPFKSSYQITVLGREREENNFFPFLSFYSAEGFVSYTDFLYYLDLQAVMAEARSQQAASLTEFQWLGNRFPITNAKTRVAILKGLLLALPMSCANVHNEVKMYIVQIKNQN